jgi:hypothetical protein
MKNAPSKISFLTIPLIILVLLGGIYFARRSGTNPNAYSNDFNVYYFAAREIVEGRTPYDNSLGTWTPYLYPPLLAELFVLVAGLPLSLAAYLWFLISAFSIFIAARMSASLINHLDNPSKRYFIIIVSLLGLARFILDNFDYGQVNTVVAALVVAHFYFYLNNKKLISIGALVLAASIKLTPLIFIGYHLAKRRFKFAAACAVLFVAINALSFVPFTSRADDAFTTFFNRTVKNEQGFNFAYDGNQSLRASLERFKGRVEATAPSSLSTIIAGIVLLALAGIVATRVQNEIAAGAPFFCLAVLLSPLAWKQHFVMLILPLAFLIGETLNEKDKRTKYLLVSLLGVVFAFFNLTSPKIIGLAGAEWSDAHSLIFAGGMLLYIGSMIRALQTSPVINRS